MATKNFSKIYRYNRFFKQVHDKVFDYRQGSIPILISAPHSVPVLKKSYQKPHESFTGALALYFNEILGTHAFYSLNLKMKDPNRDRNCVYKSTLSSYIDENNVKYIIDLHGADLEHDFAVDLGTNRSRSISADVLNKIVDTFHDYGVSPVVENDTFGATHPSVITNYISSRHDNVQAVQFEINKYYRDPFHNPQEFTNLLQSLTTIIQILERATYAESRLEHSIL